MSAVQVSVDRRGSGGGNDEVNAMAASLGIILGADDAESGEDALPGVPLDKGSSRGTTPATVRLNHTQSGVSVTSRSTAIHRNSSGGNAVPAVRRVDGAQDKAGSDVTLPTLSELKPRYPDSSAKVGFVVGTSGADVLSEGIGAAASVSPAPSPGPARRLSADNVKVAGPGSPAGAADGSGKGTERTQSLRSYKSAGVSGNARKILSAAKRVQQARALKEVASYNRFERAIQGRRGSMVGDDDDDDGVVPHDPLVVSPYSSFRRNWDTVSLALIFSQALMIPFWVSFDVEPSTAWTVFDYFIDVFFMLDIVLNFRTGFVDDGDLVMQARFIAPHYLKTWFPLDLIATFPYSWILDPLTSQDAARGTTFYELPSMIRFVRMVRLVRLMRLARVSSRMAAVAELGQVSKTVLRIVRLLFWTSVIAHISGCFWALIALLEDHGPNSWTTLYGVDPEDHAAVYMSAMYWSLATLTTVGYGDVHAGTQSERVFSLVLMLTGAVIFAMIVGRMSQLAQSINRAAMVRQQAQDDVHDFMRFRSIPKDLRMRMRQYYSYQLESKVFFDEQAIMEDLSPALRREVHRFITRDVVKSVPFLRDADMGFVNAIAPKLKPSRSIPGDYIIVAGEMGEEMWMLKSGEVEVVSREGNIIRILGGGSFFGEIAILENCRRTVSVRARTNCDMYSLNKRDLLSALSDYPTFSEGLRLVGRARRNGKPDPNLAHMKKAPPPFGLATWASVFENKSDFLERAQQLAAQVEAKTTQSAWGKLRGGALMASAKIEKAKVAASGKGPTSSRVLPRLPSGKDAKDETRRHTALSALTSPAGSTRTFGTRRSSAASALSDHHESTDAKLEALATQMRDMQATLLEAVSTLGTKVAKLEASIGGAVG